MLSTWLRVIRVKFLLASVVAVSAGLVISWWQTNSFDLLHAMLTMVGVLALHASVDLFNDYWDYKRGIDTHTQRTKVSGGTGVLPEGLLDPSKVYKAGIAFLIFGSIIGGYFVITGGIVIAILLTFAILSIYFYSTKIVDYGLAEFFVAVKGTMIVLGTYFIQTSQLDISAAMGGMFVGVLSAMVLFITSFPDHDADKSKGRKTLVILLGKQKATYAFWLFPLVGYAIIGFGVFFEIFPIICLATLLTLPILIKAGNKLKNDYQNIGNIILVMDMVLTYSRITGAIFVAGFLINM